MERDAAEFKAFMLHESYWGENPIEPPTDKWVADWLKRQVEAQAQHPRWTYFFAVRHRETGKLVGDAILRRWDEVSGDIGWSVDAPFRNQGFATEIGAAMLRMGMDTLGLHRVCGMCRVGNEASRRVMVKLGMQMEGTLREHVHARGVWWSSWLYSILSTEARPPCHGRKQIGLDTNENE